MCSGSTRGECRLPQISAGKPTWEFGAKCTWEQISKSHPCGLALPTSRVDKKGISGNVATQCSPVQQGRASFSHHRGTLIPPSLHTQAPSYQKTLVILESAGECHIPGKFVSSAQDSSWLISLFAAQLSETPVWQATGRARKKPEKVNSLSEMDPPFHLAGNPKEGTCLGDEELHSFYLLEARLKSQAQPEPELVTAC